RNRRLAFPRRPRRLHLDRNALSAPRLGLHGAIERWAGAGGNFLAPPKPRLSPNAGPPRRAWREGVNLVGRGPGACKGAEGSGHGPGSSGVGEQTGFSYGPRSLLSVDGRLLEADEAVPLPAGAGEPGVGLGDGRVGERAR